MTLNIKDYMHGLGTSARAASRLIANADSNAKNKALTHISGAVLREKALLLAANKQDVDAAKAAGLDDAMLDRLTLTEKSIQSMAEGLLQIATLADPDRKSVV